MTEPTTLADLPLREDLAGVRAAIAEAMPLLSGQMDGYRFAVTGSPLRE